MDNGAIIYSQYLCGDDAALVALVEAYGDALTRFAFCFVNDSAAAEDVTAETFATLVFKRKRFEGEQGFKTYLFTIARNKCYDYLRSRKRFAPLRDLENVLFVDDVEEQTLRNEKYKRLYESLQRIPIQYRDVLTLVYLQEFSVTEVCKIMKKSVKQVYNLLARAKESLKKQLVSEGDLNENNSRTNGIDKRKS